MQFNNVVCLVGKLTEQVLYKLNNFPNKNVSYLIITR